MLKNKRVLLVLILALFLLLIPNMVQAKSVEATETTTTSTGIVVKWEYELDSNNDIVALMCANISEVSGNLTIPSTIDGYKVKGLGRVKWNHTNNYYDVGTFEKAYGLQSVTIPNTVTVIGDDAFKQCTGLKQLVIPDSVNSIGDYAFSACTGISILTIGNGVTNIGYSAFSYCSGIRKLVIPNNVINVGANAFYGCTGISSLTLSENMTTIRGETFYGCSGLTTVVLPNSITTLNSSYGVSGAFEKCVKLSKILIPDSVVTIDPKVFENCDKLTIYGNDGQVSKTYAEENKIKFDYIANWDKASAGTDVTAPTVKSMFIKYNSVSNYFDETTNTFNVPKGAQIIIVVNFSEQITGNTAPTLAIKCGTGNSVDLTNGVISGDTVTYTYTIQETDLGQIVSVSLTGGDITDLQSNKAELSCTELYVQYESGEYAYANGKSADVKKDEDIPQKPSDSGSSSNEENTNKKEDNKPATNGTQQSSNNTEISKKDDIKDDTVKKDNKLPQTGVTLLSLGTIFLIVVAVISKVKYKGYENI